MKVNLKALVVWGSLMLLLAACTTGGKTRLIDVFFDGVPPDKKASDNKVPVAKSPVNAIKTEEELPEIYKRARAAPPGSRHQPFINRECILCHESEFSEKLRAETTKLCADCHKAYFDPVPFPHAPIKDGKCMECHKPHASPEASLLNKPESEGCAKCHPAEKLRTTPEHAEMGNAACHSCHEVHGGQKKFLLKGDYAPGSAGQYLPAPKT
jgi:predicted CXXCH cytochrome family protein